MLFSTRSQSCIYEVTKLYQWCRIKVAFFFCLLNISWEKQKCFEWIIRRYIKGREKGFIIPRRYQKGREKDSKIPRKYPKGKRIPQSLEGIEKVEKTIPQSLEGIEKEEKNISQSLEGLKKVDGFHNP